jgi:hypothetical protein
VTTATLPLKSGIGLVSSWPFVDGVRWVVRGKDAGSLDMWAYRGD